MFAVGRLGRVIRPDLVSALKRFPIPIAAALVASVTLIMRMEHLLAPDGEYDDRVLLGAATAFATGMAGRILLEGANRPAGTILSQTVAVFPGLGAALAYSSLWLSPTILIAALALIVIAAPGMSAGGTPIRFWVFNTRSVLAGLIGLVGAGLFVIGLWAILATLRSLFELQISHRLVSYASIVGFSFVLPVYWLSLQPKISEIEDREPLPDMVLRAGAGLTDFIFVPLLAIYAVILHVYAAKIAIDAALPRGQIGWMVSVFLGLGYLTFLLALPEQSPLASARRLFRSFWPPATLIPVGLLALGLQKRIQDYGITEDRYLIAAVALYAALLFLVWLPRRQLDVRLVPAVAAGLLLIGDIGPLSADFMTVHSQARRFIAVLDASGELKDGRFDGERTTPWGKETRTDLRSIIDLLDRRGALSLIAPAVGEELAADAALLVTKLDLNRSEEVKPAPLDYVRIDAAVLTDRFYWSSLSATAKQAIIFRAPDSPEYALKVEGRRVSFSGPGDTFTFDLSAEPEHGAGSDASYPRVSKANDTRAVLILRELRWNGSGETRTLDPLRGEVLLRSP